MELPMNERRKEIRRKLMAFTPVYDLGPPRILLGYLGDLTLQGALVIGEKLIEVNKEISLGIEFPNDLADIKVTRVALPARIAWCRQDDSPLYYNIGVEFTEVTPHQVEIFHEILTRYHFRYVLSDADFKRG
jgi:hypothetical protein